MPSQENVEPLTTALLVRRAKVLLVRSNDLHNESERLKRQSQELLEAARQFDANAQLDQDAGPPHLVETAVATAARAFSYFGEFLTHPRHLFRHAR